MSATAAPPAASSASVLDGHGLSRDTLAQIADASLDTDRSATDLRPLLRRLGSEGRADLGLPGASGPLTEQAAVIARIARECMASAFSLWAQRLASEYVVAHGGPSLQALGVRLRTGETPGVSAMAPAFRHVAGIATAPITFRREGDELVLDGPVSWASNLHDDAVIVAVARPETDNVDGAGGGQGPIIVVVPVATPGLTVRPADGLLALDSTRSGSVRLSSVRVPASHIVSEDLPAFVDAIRPVFLSLQASFCTGLGAAALDAAPAPKGVAQAFEPERERLVVEQARVETTLVDLADRASGDSPPEASEYLRLRLDAALFAGAACRLELCLTGGRGYVASSATARRTREALFLPIQSPTESELRWMLSRSA